MMRDGEAPMKLTWRLAELALMRRRDELVRSPLSQATAPELTEVEQALHRLQTGRFGVCERCDGPIGLQRLRAVPETRFCLSCHSPH